nr:hypothetical protein [Tanacetum cinerariifolium]
HSPSRAATFPATSGDPQPTPPPPLPYYTAVTPLSHHHHYPAAYNTASIHSRHYTHHTAVTPTTPPPHYHHHTTATLVTTVATMAAIVPLHRHHATTIYTTTFISLLFQELTHVDVIRIGLKLWNRWFYKYQVDEKDGIKVSAVDVKLLLSDAVTLEEVDAEKDAEVQGRLPESQAQVYHLDLEHAQKVISMQENNEAEPAEVEEVLEVVTAAKLMTEVVTTATTTITAAPISKVSAPRRRRGGIIQDSKEDAIASLNVQSEALLEKGENEIEEEESKLSKRKCENLEQKATKKQKIDEEIVQERFASSEPKNFSEDLLLNAFKTMFEKPNVEANIWKNQRGIYGFAKVKSWKLLESCKVHITFTTTQMIMLVERRYLLTRFTIERMLTNVRLEVVEETEVSLKLLRFVRRQQQEELDNSLSIIPRPVGSKPVPEEPNESDAHL